MRTPIHVGQERTFLDDGGERRLVRVDCVRATTGDVAFSWREDERSHRRTISADEAAERLLSKADLATLARDDELVRYRDAGDRFVEVERGAERGRREVSLAQLSLIEGALRAGASAVSTRPERQRLLDALAVVDGVRRGVR